MSLRWTANAASLSGRVGKAEDQSPYCVKIVAQIANAVFVLDRDPRVRPAITSSAAIPRLVKPGDARLPSNRAGSVGNHHRPEDAALSQEPVSAAVRESARRRQRCLAVGPAARRAEANLRPASPAPEPQSRGAVLAQSAAAPHSRSARAVPAAASPPARRSSPGQPGRRSPAAQAEHELLIGVSKITPSGVCAA